MLLCDDYMQLAIYQFCRGTESPGVAVPGLLQVQYGSMVVVALRQPRKGKLYPIETQKYSGGVCPVLLIDSVLTRDEPLLWSSTR